MSFSFTKNNFVSSLNALINYDLIEGETINISSVDKIVYLKPSIEQKSNVNIYSDVEFSEMMAIENFLKNADDSDWKILKLTKENQKREFISDVTFLSSSAIKYRVKSYCKNFKVDNIDEVVEILEKYSIL